MEVKDWINVAYIIIVIIVFIIQYYQIKKQNSLLSYYDKIFNIIKIDEIEKYVKLKEDNVKLELDNKHKTLSSLMDNAETMNKDAGKTVKDAGILLNKLEYLNHNNKFFLDIIELNKSELTSSYKIIFDELEKIQEIKIKESLNKSLIANMTKFESERNELMKELNRN